MLPPKGRSTLVEHKVLTHSHRLSQTKSPTTHFWDALFVNFRYNARLLDQTIDSILTAHSRCEVASHYVQAIKADNGAFLLSNLGEISPAEPFTIQVTPVGSCWLLGEAMTCAIADQRFDHCHAAIGHDANGFYVVDVGSHSGTYLNCRQIPPQVRRTLRDGDLLGFGSHQVEFFIHDCDGHTVNTDPFGTTYG